jgi:hypothetical protein
MRVSRLVMKAQRTPTLVRAPCLVACLRVEMVGLKVRKLVMMAIQIMKMLVQMHV